VRSSDETRHIFVVRVWREAGGPWRGAVEHAATGQHLYFASLDEMTDYIALRLGSAGMGRRRPGAEETVAGAPGEQ
jgi:hypothetical protein